LGKAIPDISRKRLYDAAVEIRQRVSKAGSKIKHPVNWDSVKQRIAFFASGGFGQGIPYRRRGKFEKSWKIKPVERGYKVFSSYPKSVFVSGLFSGKGQSNINKGRWTLFRTAINAVLKKLPKAVVNSLKPYLKARP
jgi:hypothetical protein